MKRLLLLIVFAIVASEIGSTTYYTSTNGDGKTGVSNEISGTTYYTGTLFGKGD